MSTFASCSMIAALAYQLTPTALPGRPVVRATAPAMEARLNNYVLPGPMTPLGNQVSGAAHPLCLPLCHKVCVKRVY